MPLTRIIFYQEEPSKAPVVDWLRELRRTDRLAYAKCVARIRRLAALRHELRRPEADILRDDVYELRTKKDQVQYRVRYFFSSQNIAVLRHALTKEGKIPDADIERAVRRKKAFTREPACHT